MARSGSAAAGRRHRRREAGRWSEGALDRPALLAEDRGGQYDVRGVHGGPRQGGRDQRERRGAHRLGGDRAGEGRDGVGAEDQQRTDVAGDRGLEQLGRRLSGGSRVALGVEQGPDPVRVGALEHGEEARADRFGEQSGEPRDEIQALGGAELAGEQHAGGGSAAQRADQVRRLRGGDPGPLLELGRRPPREAAPPRLRPGRAGVRRGLEGEREHQGERRRLAVGRAGEPRPSEPGGAPARRREHRERVAPVPVARVEHRLRRAGRQREQVADDEQGVHRVDLFDALDRRGPGRGERDAAQQGVVLRLAEVDVGRADGAREAHRRRRLLAGELRPQEQADRAAAVGRADPLESLAGEAERFVPAGRAHRAAVAQQRRLEAPRMGHQLERHVALGAERAAVGPAAVEVVVERRRTGLAGVRRRRFAAEPPGAPHGAERTDRADPVGHRVSPGRRACPAPRRS